MTIFCCRSGKVEMEDITMANEMMKELNEQELENVNGGCFFCLAADLAKDALRITRKVSREIAKEIHGDRHHHKPHRR